MPIISKQELQSETASTCNAARKLFAKMQEDDIVLADLRLLDGDGIALLEELRVQGRNNPYIVMTDYDEVPTAVRSMKSGAEGLHTEKVDRGQPVPAPENFAETDGTTRTADLRAAERGFP